MNFRNDGIKAAFPLHPDIDADGYRAGMSLRDWFAGQAIRSLLGADVQLNINEHQAGEYARFAFMVADAMIKAREVKP